MKKKMMKVLSGLMGISCLVGSLPISVQAQELGRQKLTIDLSQTRQEIDGFGVSQAAWSNAIYDLEEPARSEVLDLLFTEQKVKTTKEVSEYHNGSPVGEVREGIGLEIFRGNIFPTYTTQDESGKIIYDFANERYDQAWVMKEAKKRGVDTFMASVWSPPAFMKTNGQTVRGGKLKPEYYGEFAKLMAEFVVQFEELYGIEMDAISMANEPNSMTFLSWDSCEWYAPQIIDFAKNHLGPTFEEYGLQDVMLITDENSWWSDDKINKVLEDKEAAAVFDIAASHNYRVPGGSKKPVVPFEKAKALGKKVWMTEVSTEGECDPGMESALEYAKEVAQMFSKAEVNAYLYWTGVIPSASDETLIYGNLDKSEYVLTKRFFTFGNYSKFIKPGYKRVRVGEVNQEEIENAEIFPGVWVSAYTEEETGKVSVVMVNTNASVVEMDLDFTGTDEVISKLNTYVTSENYDLEKVSPIYLEAEQFALELLPESVTTFTGQCVDPSIKVVSTLEGAEEVKSGEVIDITVGVEQLKAPSYASDLYVLYDPEVLSFEGVAKEGEIIPSIQQIDDQTLRILSSLPEGKQVAAETGTLQFKALDRGEETTTKLRVVTGSVGSVFEGETSQLPVDIAEQNIKVIPETPPYEGGDVNEDHEIDVADLALIAYYYAADITDPNWITIKRCDVNRDNKIDIGDLTMVANRILN